MGTEITKANPISPTQQRQELSRTLETLVVLLRKLATRRQAVVTDATFTIYAQDLLSSPLTDTEKALEEIGMNPRRDGETAFPDIGTIREVVVRTGYERRLRERAAEETRNAEEQRAYFATHPEERFTMADVCREAGLFPNTREDGKERGKGGLGRIGGGR